MDSSSQQNQYPYPPASQPYNPSRFQSYNSNYHPQQQQHHHHPPYHPQQQQQHPPYHPQPYHHHHQQQQPQQHQPYQQQQQPQQHQPYQPPQQLYSSYYTPNYSNPYPPQHPQTHHQQRHHQETPIHPPGVSIQPSSASSHGQTHFQLSNQQNPYRFPQKTDGVGLGMNPKPGVAGAALNPLAGSVGATERPVGSLPGQSWYPQSQGFGPVIGGPGIYTGPGLGSGAFPGHGPMASGSTSHAGQSSDNGGGGRGGGQSLDRGGGRRGTGQSLDRGGGRRRRRDRSSDKGGGRRRRRDRSSDKGGGRRRRRDRSSDNGGGRRRRGDQREGRRRRVKDSNAPKVGMCELCNIDCGCLGILKMHLNGKRHKKKLEQLEANKNKTVDDLENVQKPSGDLNPGTATEPDNLLMEEETKQNPPQNIHLDGASSDNKLETEEKIKNEQQADPSEDANGDLLGKNPMMNQSGLSSESKVETEEKINDAQQADPPEDANGELLGKKPMMNQSDLSSESKLETEEKINNAQQADPPEDANSDFLGKKPVMFQSENQKSGVKRKTLVDGSMENEASKAKRLVIEPSNSKVVIPLTSDMGNVQCDNREILTQEVLNGAQVSDPIADASLLPQNENATLPKTGVSLN